MARFWAENDSETRAHIHSVDYYYYYHYFTVLHKPQAVPNNTVVELGGMEMM